MDGPSIDPQILAQLPQRPFLLTARVDDACTGLVTPWVLQCSVEPPLLVVAIPRGTEIEPLIRDSRQFALTALTEGDRMIDRRFDPPPPRNVDPFVGMRVMTGTTGCPILRRGQFWFECELVGHLAPESTHRLYIGQVLASGICQQAGSETEMATSRN
ncbi:MAG: flavin reductase family protein [Phycisphaerales bacterium]|nr:flavin reductase family protein [Phycisphaerales bacterium]